MSSLTRGAKPGTHQALADQLTVTAAARRIGILTGNTSDLFLDDNGHPLHLVEFIAATTAGLGQTPVRYSLGHGLEVLVPPGSMPSPGATARLPENEEPQRVLEGLTPLIEDSEERVALIIDHAEHLMPASPNGAMPPDQARVIETVFGWAHSPRFLQGTSSVWLISRGAAVAESLEQAPGFERITVPYPNRTVRMAFVDRLDGRADADIPHHTRITDPAAVADQSGGLRLEDLFRLGREAAHHETPLDTGYLQGRKRYLVDRAAGGLVQVHEPGYGFAEVAGLDHLAEWTHDLAATGVLPDGVLFVGPPGVGKSFAVRAIAHDLDLPLVSMRSIRSMWVGESERNLELVLSLVDAMAPCVVWIDEIDQIIGQRTSGPSADGGTNERMMARLLEAMGDRDRTHGVLWIGTSNRPDLLDTAIVDRFPMVWPFFHPTTPEIAALIPTIATQRGYQMSGDFDPDVAASHSALSLTTVRIIADLLDEAARFAAADDGAATICQSHFEEAAADRWTTLDVAEHEYLALLGLSMAGSANRLPWRTRVSLRPRAVLPIYIGDLVDSRGIPDGTLVANRLADLEVERMTPGGRR